MKLFVTNVTIFLSVSHMFYTAYLVLVSFFTLACTSSHAPKDHVNQCTLRNPQPYTVFTHAVIMPLSVMSFMHLNT